jgi:hypothetical protein
MGSPSLGNHLSKGSVLGRNFQIGRGFGMIASRKRLGRSPKQASREVVMRTWPLSVRQEREKERVPTRRVTMRGKPHSRGRRRT